jgi:hypothetical protein
VLALWGGDLAQASANTLGNVRQRVADRHLQTVLQEKPVQEMPMTPPTTVARW